MNGQMSGQMPGQTSFVQQAPVQPETSARFGDLHPPFDKQAAIPEANRCLFCFDAPCASACPTHIDVPRFIKKIASGNLAAPPAPSSMPTFSGPVAPGLPSRRVVRRGLCTAPLQQATDPDWPPAALRHGCTARQRRSPCPLHPPPTPVSPSRSSAPARHRLRAPPNCAAAASGLCSSTRGLCPAASTPTESLNTSCPPDRKPA